ncbi:MAG TPA: hypothetical protein VKU60_16015, partial [Chloroflexota bacterium]|nr:hypothetical protein [Chloroflexota bacterium]
MSTQSGLAMTRRQVLKGAGLALLAGPALAACGGAQPPQSSSQPAAGAFAPSGSAAAVGTTLQAMIDGARKEGKRVLISSDETIGGNETIQQF